MQLARHPSINNQSITGEKEEKKAVGVRRDAGRQINKYDYGSRARGVASTVQHTTCDSIDKLRDTGHAMLDT